MTHVQNILIFLTLQLNVAHINISVLNTVPYFFILGVKKKIITHALYMLHLDLIQIEQNV